VGTRAYWLGLHWAGYRIYGWTNRCRQISDKTVVRMTKANNGVFEPEMRLPACIFFACWVPVTFFWYGWTADKHVHVSHTVPAPTTDVVSDPVLTKVKVDCSLHWPYPFRLWHDGNLHPHSNLYH
jgi:hypothetical protein